jgi:hypothetical protein
MVGPLSGRLVGVVTGDAHSDVFIVECGDITERCVALGEGQWI